MTDDNKLQSLFDICPYSTMSSFEQEHFINSVDYSKPRKFIEIINRIRKIDSDLIDEHRLYEKNLLNEEKKKLIEFLNSKNYDEVVDTIKNWELTERDYWVDYLGKTAALEILSQGRISLETMTLMVRLPEDLYIKSTQICVKLANNIRQATVHAEELIGLVSEDSAETDTKKTLLLKKVKE